MTDERKDQLTAEADGLIEGRNAVKNNKNRRGNRNLLGAAKLVAWALALT